MNGSFRRDTTQRGFANNKLLLFLMGLVCFWMGKGLLFPAIEGQTSPQLVARYGEPISKTGLPRPR